MKGRKLFVIIQNRVSTLVKQLNEKVM